MDTKLYIISQIFVIINYICLVIVFQVKSRKSMILLNFGMDGSTLLAYLCLGGYTGVLMMCVDMLSNTYYMWELRHEDYKHIKLVRNIELSILVILTIVGAIVGYDGFLSLLSVFAALVGTYAVWQKNMNVYKWLGLLISVLWLSYNAYVRSLFGVILELIALTSAIIGVIREAKNKKDLSEN